MFLFSRVKSRKKTAKISFSFNRAVLKLTSWRLNVYYELTLVHKTLSLYYTTHRRREMKLISQRKQSSVSFFLKGPYFPSFSLSLGLYVKQYQCTMPGLKRITASLPHIEESRHGCWIDTSEQECVSSLYPIFVSSYKFASFCARAKSWWNEIVLRRQRNGKSHAFVFIIR